MNKRCDYKDILGKPNEGVHKIGAIFDWIGTILISLVFGTITWYINYVVNKKNGNEKVIPIGFASFLWFIFFYLLAILLHTKFCVNTRVNKFLGII